LSNFLDNDEAPAEHTNYNTGEACKCEVKYDKNEETRIVDPTTGGEKGQKDVRLHGIPWESLSELGRVYAFGESKYDDYNFRKGFKWSLSYDALLRHLGAWWNREDNDPESSLHHLAHATWHCIALLFFSITERGTDDRPT
jgi:dATP/dGTP diphosphohydrolase, N-terminal